MLDLGWTELLVIGIVALIVVGPKDLPKMFRALGQFTAKARSMAREFQRAMDDAAETSGVKDAARDLRNATDAKSMGLDELNKLRGFDPMKPGRKSAKSIKPAESVSDADEEDLDQVEAELDRLSREKARDTKASAPATPDPVAEDKSQQ